MMQEVFLCNQPGNMNPGKEFIRAKASPRGRGFVPENLFLTTRENREYSSGREFNAPQRFFNR